ncbi:hypothetical protein KM043_015717 [Ampulex compressa]|nr:hypothetical protein KM043_015717 [Ampulex compressa]
MSLQIPEKVSTVGLPANRPEKKLTPFGQETAPFDPRFPNQNQSKHCYQYYVDFHRCSQRHGNEYDAFAFHLVKFSTVKQMIMPAQHLEL